MRIGQISRICQLVIIGLPLLFIGCTVSEIERTDDASDSTEQEHQTLQKALYLVHPIRLIFSTQSDQIISQLNDWENKYNSTKDKLDTDDIDRKITADTKKQLAKILTEKELKNLSSPNYNLQDLNHLRDSMVLKKITEFAPQLSDSDLDRSVDLFYYVVRNIELLNSSQANAEKAAPTFFRFLLFGRGTAKDRAWVFAGLLRQLKIPAVILKPSIQKTATQKTATQKTESPFLVGVLINKNIYLFDTRLGLPIPSPNDPQITPLIRQPATLTEFIEQPAIAAALNTESFQYDFSPENMKQSSVELIGHRSLWAKRMRWINNSYAGKSKPVFYESLDGKKVAGGREGGLIKQVITSGKERWTRKNISFWKHPEQTIQRYENRNTEQKLERKRLLKPFEAPIHIKYNPETHTAQIGGPRYKQLRARIYQLIGQHHDAIRTYTATALDAHKGVATIKDSKEQTDLHRETQEASMTAIEDASLWVRTIKFEQADFEKSADWLENQHLKQFAGQPRANHAKYLAALAHRFSNRFAPAKKLLKAIQKTHPQAHGNALLINRWEQQKEKLAP